MRSRLGCEYSEGECEEGEQTQQAQNEISPPRQLILHQHDSQTDAFREEPVSKFLWRNVSEPPLCAEAMNRSTTTPRSAERINLSSQRGSRRRVSAWVTN